MYERLAEVARMLGVPEERMAREVAGAIRRSEPDAREFYGVINARRFVARREPGHSEWVLSVEARRQPWETKPA